MILDMSFEEEYYEIDPVTKIHEKGNYYSSNQFCSGIEYTLYENPINKEFSTGDKIQIERSFMNTSNFFNDLLTNIRLSPPYSVKYYDGDNENLIVFEITDFPPYKFTYSIIYNDDYQIQSYIINRVLYNQPKNRDFNFNFIVKFNQEVPEAVDVSSYK